MSRYWSDRVSDLNPYVPGEQTESRLVTKLNTNESPFGPSERVIEAISRCVGEDLRLYPDPRSLALRDAIASVEGVNRDNVFVGNGSDEVLAHTFQAFFSSSRPILFPDVTYSFYPSYCRLFGLNYEQIPLNDDFVISVESYSKENGGVILPNPNAPTGIDLGLKAIRELLKINLNRLLLLMRLMLILAAESAATLLGEFPNLLVTRSFSKSYALAGLRVGYALGQVELIEGLHRVKDSFNSYPVDRLASAGAIAAIQDRDYLDNIRRQIVSNREQLVSGLSELGFFVLPSATNFVFVRHEHMSAKSLNQELRKVEILVRHFTRPARIEEFLRITVGTEAMVNKLLKSLKLILRR
jgi:histidinol-phosphate aminotransferase